MSISNSEDKSNPYLADPDVGLMLDFQNGNKASFETLLRKYFPRLVNFIYRFVGNRQAAEDLAQETFFRVYKSVANYTPRSKFQTWVFTIAKNLSLNELRRGKHNTVSLDETFLTGDGELKRQVEDVHSDRLDEQMLRSERAAAVKKAINHLPENQRIAVLLRRYEQFSYEEIAQTMNTSVKAIKSLLNRAKENLKIKLTKWISTP